MRILLASSEVAPFAKTGGLADVAGALPKALQKLGHDVRVVLPLYRAVDREKHCQREIFRGLPVPIAGGVGPADIWEGSLGDGIPVYFIRCDRYYDRDGLYQSKEGDHPDNAERFAFFSRAVIDLCRTATFVPDVIHGNDWQTGLVPAYLRTAYRDDPLLRRVAVLFSIHNLGYQGLFGPEALEAAGLSRDLFTPAGVEFWGKVNFLKAGLVFADALSTVSHRYSEEIQTEEFGSGLEGVLRMRAGDLFGILNGIDYEEWNPTGDPHLAAPFTRDDPSAKATCKRDLQTVMGLPPRAEVPLLGVISRLAPQKGIDLIAEVLDEVLKLDVQFVLLGTGDQDLEDRFRAIQADHPDRVAVRIGFNVALSHKIEAGADLFLMPSRYEPCGLNQMYSMAYGTIPVVRATGGLDDTVLPFDPATGEGTGFKFARAEADQLLEAVREAVATFRRPDLWRRLVRNAMGQDFSWDRSARQYEDLYRRLLARRQGAA